MVWNAVFGVPPVAAWDGAPIVFGPSDEMTDRLAILERAFQREVRSLAQYLAESWLWTHRGDREAQELLLAILTDERRWARQLGELIEQRGGVPGLGSFPPEFTNLNLHFVSLDFMLLKLADFLDRQIAALRVDSAGATDDSVVRSLIDQMIERKQGQVEALRKLADSLAVKKP